MSTNLGRLDRPPQGADKSDRRQFLARSAGSVGALALGVPYVPASVFGANERLRVGVVGTGSRGGVLMSWVHRLATSHQVQITAVCDIWTRRREQAARRVEEWNGRPPAACRTIGELCDRTDVDVVLIATPDFQHAHQAVLAVQAGKDVYVEKPLGCDFNEVRRARDLISKSDRIVQVGTQSRGSGKYYSAAEFVQSGKLGQVTYVEISEPVFQQRWRVPGCESALGPADTDWQEFLCYLPKETPFDPRHYCEFRCFWPYSSGPFCQWMSHRIDLVNLVLGQRPSAAVALGGVFLWKDGRTNPDTVQCLLEYPRGVLVSYHMRMGNSHHGRAITFYGSAGTLELEAGTAYGNGGGGLVVEGDPVAGTPRFHVDHTRCLAAKRCGGVSLDPGLSVDYLGDFLESVRLRRKPLGDIQAAFDFTLACILANQAYRRGQKMVYDPTRDEIHPASSLSGMV